RHRLHGDVELRGRIRELLDGDRNKHSLAKVVEGDESTAAMAEGARRGHATPNSPQWVAVESDNPIKPYMTAVLQGEDPKTAAKRASEKITALLAGS
ncbi:hypothetical protein ACWC1D_36765, partial [Streptomyces sp. NPDC001478]